MATERQPYYKHYPADWRGDANLRLCSLAARGLWTECLGLMHEATPRGYLLLSVEQLALIVSRPVKEVRTALAELEAHGVPSRDAQGRLYSRRMVRDTAKSLTLTTNGRKGGHPSLVNQEPRGLVNQDRASLVNQDQEETDASLVNQALGNEKDLTKPRSKPAEKTKPQLVLDRFETFWAAFDHREKRKDALKIWAKLNPDDELLGKILDAITRWKGSRKWREGFQPLATTWLNAEGWNDEVPPEQAPLMPLTMTKSEQRSAKNAASLAAVIASYQAEESEELV